MAQYDLVIRGGNVADGSGGELYQADVAITDGLIVEIGQIAGAGTEEIDARGQLVTPGFVDLHTHYDGQVTWDNRLTPSSGHGVTTCVLGNCGVGFAPCKPEQRESMIEVMEGVEDIPNIVMAEGLPWNWETFPDYLDAIEKRPMDVDFAALVPHIPVRIYVMGDRGTRREPANPNDIHRMAEIVREGLEAGAVGFTTSRAAGHRTASGDVAPSTTAGEDELLGIAMAMKAAGKGMIHTASDFGDVTYGQSMEFNMWRRIAEASGRPTSFPLLQQNDNPARWELIAQACADARAAGVKMTGQVVARPVGVLYALELTSNPFSGCASYKAIAHLPLAERVKAMRDPEVRARILSEDAYLSDARVLRMTREVANMYRMGDPPNYSPPLDQRFDHLAKAQGVTPFEIAYDVLLENDGHAIIYQPATNYSHHNLDAVLAMMKRPDTIMGIADGGAHLGRICDASTPTHMLTYWTRDRQGERLSVPWVVKALSSETAAYIGFNDRGLIKVGYKADLNVIDYDNLTLHAPHPSYDLPAGGMRLTQSADGYTATIVSGVVTYRDGQATGALPGKLVRGEQPAPTVKVAAKPEVVMA